METITRNQGNDDFQEIFFDQMRANTRKACRSHAYKEVMGDGRTRYLHNLWA